jgi:hypothetical protein
MPMKQINSAVIIAALLAGLGPTQAMTACREAPAGKTYWSWREIDGRRCYYEGRITLPKSELHWGDAPAKSRAIAPESTTRSERANRAESTMIRERAKQTESTKEEERATRDESTKQDERARSTESTKENERAIAEESTKPAERANQSESTTQRERAIQTESTKADERIVDVPSRVMREGMSNKSNWIDGLGRPIDLMGGEELTGPSGLGGLLVIPPYHAALSQ